MTYPPTDVAEHSDLIARFLRGWEQFRKQCNALCELVQDDVELPCWIWRHGEGFTARESAASIYTRHFYDDDQSATESVILPGLLGASAQTLRIAHAANAARAIVREALAELDRITVPIVNPVTGRKRRERLGTLVLRDAGLARLHRVQVYRDIHVLDRAPDRVSFVWARTRRVTRLTADEVRAKLHRLQSNPPQAAFVENDLRVLASLPRSERLAYVEAMPCHARVNLAWRIRGAKKGFTRTMRPAPMPLLYPGVADAPLPRLKPLEDCRDTPRQRAKRKDVHLESTPVLSSMPVYRYR